MPRVNFNKKRITFTFEEANKLMSYMEKIGSYGGHRTGKTAFQVMDEFGVLGVFGDLYEIVRRKYEK